MSGGRGWRDLALLSGPSRRACTKMVHRISAMCVRPRAFPTMLVTTLLFKTELNHPFCEAPKMKTKRGSRGSSACRRQSCHQRTALCGVCGRPD